MLVNPLLNLFFLAQPWAFSKVKICQQRLNPNPTGVNESGGLELKYEREWHYGSKHSSQEVPLKSAGVVHGMFNQ